MESQVRLTGAIYPEENMGPRTLHGSTVIIDGYHEALHDHRAFAFSKLWNAVGAGGEVSLILTLPAVITAEVIMGINTSGAWTIKHYENPTWTNKGDRPIEAFDLNRCNPLSLANPVGWADPTVAAANRGTKLRESLVGSGAFVGGRLEFSRMMLCGVEHYYRMVNVSGTAQYISAEGLAVIE